MYILDDFEQWTQPERRRIGSKGLSKQKERSMWRMTRKNFVHLQCVVQTKKM